MSAVEHDAGSTVGRAAQWLRGIPIENRPRPIIPSMCRRFGMSPKEAIEAIRDAEARPAEGRGA